MESRKAKAEGEEFCYIAVVRVSFRTPTKTPTTSCILFVVRCNLSFFCFNTSVALCPCTQLYWHSTIFRLNCSSIYLTFWQRNLFIWQAAAVFSNICKLCFSANNSGFLEFKFGKYLQVQNVVKWQGLSEKNIIRDV